MKKYLFFTILSLALVLTGCGNEITNDNSENNNQTPDSSVTEAEDTNIEGDSEINNSENDSEKVENGEIEIFNVKAGDELSSPLNIKGEGLAFENVLIVELRNSNHEALVKEPVTVKASEIGQKGPFEINLHFQFTNTKEGYLAVYEESAKDGSEKNLVEIPVKFIK